MARREFGAAMLAAPFPRSRSGSIQRIVGSPKIDLGIGIRPRFPQGCLLTKMTHSWSSSPGAHISLKNRKNWHTIPNKTEKSYIIEIMI